MRLLRWIIDRIHGRRSRVGAILEKKGSIRVVVTDGWFKHHMGEGERLFVLPHRVKQPIPWGCIPNVIRMAEEYAAKRK